MYSIIWRGAHHAPPVLIPTYLVVTVNIKHLIYDNDIGKFTQYIYTVCSLCLAYKWERRYNIMKRYSSFPSSSPSIYLSSPANLKTTLLIPRTWVVYRTCSSWQSHIPWWPVIQVSGYFSDVLWRVQLLLPVDETSKRSARMTEE